MSRIGKKPVAIPSGVTVTLDGQALTVKGPKGQLAWTATEDNHIGNPAHELVPSPRNDSNRARAMWGLSRTLVGLLPQGKREGPVNGAAPRIVGYRATLKGQSL